MLSLQYSLIFPSPLKVLPCTGTLLISTVSKISPSAATTTAAAAAAAASAAAAAAATLPSPAVCLLALYLTFNIPSWRTTRSCDEMSDAARKSLYLLQTIQGSSSKHELNTCTHHINTPHFTALHHTSHHTTLHTTPHHITSLFVQGNAWNSVSFMLHLKGHANLSAPRV